MAEKIDMVYNTVCKIDERQRVKAEKDDKRHAVEDKRMTKIETDLNAHKKIYNEDRLAHKNDRSVLYNLEQKRIIKDKLKSLAMKSVAALTAVTSLIYGVTRII